MSEEPDAAAPASVPAAPQSFLAHPIPFGVVLKWLGSVVLVVASAVGAYFAAVSKFEDLVEDEHDARVAAVSSATATLDVRLQGLERTLTKVDVRTDGVEKRLESIERRLDVLGKRMDVEGSIWTKDHVKRRETFCTGRCGAKEAECHADCRAQYNACGVRCESDPRSPCFTDCIAPIGKPASNAAAQPVEQE